MKRSYPERNLVPLDKLIEIRVGKVDKLIEDEQLMSECGDEAMFAKYQRRINEYASVVEGLVELKAYKEKYGDLVVALKDGDLV